MTASSRPCLCAVLLVFLSGIPRLAHAQWYVSGFYGAVHTQNATVSIREPSPGISVDFHDVQFSSESFQGRWYYGLRLGRMGKSDRRLGYEIELIHAKAIADTTRNYDVTPASAAPLPASGASPMNLFVQEYRMTHGLNFALFNVVKRRPIGASGTPVSLMIRGGAGLTFPHAETTVNGRVVHRYQYAGPGAQGAAGLQIKLPYRASALAEYKLTYARPKIDTALGTASMKAVSHHIAFGVAFALTRS